MTNASWLCSRVSAREALDLQLQTVAGSRGFAATRAARFEFTSRGDRVPGLLYLPPDASPSDTRVPWVLLQHGLAGSKEAAYLEVAARWVAEGVAVASIDLPLHGERSSPKLSERLFEAAIQPGETLGRESRTLLLEFARQAIIDLRRACDALCTVRELDSQRFAFAGFSLGAMLGVPFCAQDPRPRGAVLALAGAGLGPRELDPAAFAKQISPRPLIMVNAKNDERVPAAHAQALYEAAAEPRELHWFESDHDQLPGQALKTMWEALRTLLEA